MNNTQSITRLPLRVRVLRAMLVAVLLVYGLGWIVRPAVAQTSSIEMKVTSTFDGNFKYGEWLPVLVELTNSGSDLEGEIDIQVTSSQGTLVFQSPVSLPSGAHKLVPVYVLPNNFSRELNVRLVSQGKTVASEKAKVHPQPNISYFIGMLAPQRGALSLLSGLTFPRTERPKVMVDLALGDLPDRPEGLRSFDLLIVNDTDTSKLTPEQAAALETWVQQGGRLVIGGGSHAMQTVAGLPAAILPVKVESTSEVSADTLKPLAEFAGGKAIQNNGPFVAAQGTATNSHILAGDDSLALIQERSLGLGTVNFVAFDLSGIPFDGWTGTQVFWENLLGPSRAFSDNLPFDISTRQYRANMLNYAVSNIPSLDLPSIQGLSVLLGLYVLFVGPINFLFLRWRKRLQLAWVTVPLLTAGFTAGAFGIAYTLRGNDLILNKVAIVAMQPGGNAAVTSYMGLFSPRMQSYTINIEGDSLISPMNYDQGMVDPSGAASGGEMTFVQGRPAQVKGLSVNQWAMQSFMAEGVWKNFGQITGELRMENETLVGKVRNDTQYTLKDAVLTMQSRFVRLGDLAPGEEKEISLGLSSLQSDRFGTPLSYRLYQEQFANSRPPRDAQIKSNIISSIFENGPWAKLSSSIRQPGSTGPLSGIIVFGWLDQAPPSVDVPGTGLSQKATVLVYTGLDYQLPTSGLLAIPPGMIAGSFTQMPENAGTCGASGSIHMTRGEAVMEFTAPENLKNYTVDTLKLALWLDSGNAGMMPTIALYNWQDKTWTNIKEPVQGTNIIQKASPYMSENGLVRIHLSSQSELMGCIYVDLGLEAQPIQGKGS